jgi:hypothetical protein
MAAIRNNSDVNEEPIRAIVTMLSNRPEFTLVKRGNDKFVQPKKPLP